MDWKQVDAYLADIAKLTHEAREGLKLFRQCPNGGQQHIEVTEKNVNDGYLKPDMGYGARLNTYWVQVVNPYRGNTLTSWSLYEFPSCCAFCVSTQARVEKPYIKKGVNTRSNLFRQELAKDAGYSALICTDIETNTAERKTLAKNGFKDIYTISNKRTGNTVLISVKEL